MTERERCDPSRHDIDERTDAKNLNIVSICMEYVHLLMLRSENMDKNIVNAPKSLKQ